MVGVGILGPLALWDVAGTAVALRSMRQRRLLAALTLHAGSPVEAPVLAELVWGAVLPLDVAAALHTNVARLRSVLPDPLRIHTSRGAYRLEVRGGAIDAQQMIDAVDRADRTDDPGERVDVLEAALALWRGRPFADLDDGEGAAAVAGEVARLTEVMLSAHESLASALLAVGRVDHAIAALQALIVREPLRERPVGLLMDALVRAGRQGDALRAFARLRATLVEELGVEPSPQLRQLEGRVLRQEAVDVGRGATADVGPATLPTPVGQARPARRPMLPVRPTPLFGRSSELAALGDELTRRRLVTLTGVGGVGKTSLATEVAAAVAERYPDGVHLWELGHVPAAGAVDGAVATMLGAPPLVGMSLAESIADVLRDRVALVIVDNCEHVLDGVAQLAERIIAACPRVTLLATSREPLRLPAERIWTVEPLDPELAGGELFRDRAVAADAPIGGDDELVADVCRKLDGIPLAIELAAARLRTLTLGELADGLADRFRLLERGDRRATERHRTLHATIGWSHRLLTDDERRCFDRLAVFAGTFTSAAAEAVCGHPPAGAPATSELLGALVEKSMLVIDRRADATRFRVLETLRQFGEQRLAERHELRERRAQHLAHYAQLAEDARATYRRGADRATAAMLDQEWDNFRSAFQWAIRSADTGSARRLVRALFCFSWYNLRHELGRWAGQLFDVRPDAFVAGIAGCFLSKQGELDRARVIAERGLAAATSSHGDGPSLCWYSLAEVHYGIGQPQEAWSAVERACDAIDDDDGDPAVVANAFSEAAFISASLVLPHFERVMDGLQRLVDDHDDRVAEYCVQLAFAMRASAEHRPLDASPHYHEAVRLADQLGSVLHRSLAGGLLASWALGTRAPGHQQLVSAALFDLNLVRDNTAWVLIEQQAIRWARDGQLQPAATVLGYLRRHRMGHATVTDKNAAAVEVVSTARDAPSWLRAGAELSRDQLFAYAQSELDADVGSPSD